MPDESLAPHPYAMGMQVGRRAAVTRWSIVGVLSIGICAAVGVLFGQVALWGAVAAATVLYIGSMGIWFSHRDSVGGAASSNKELRHATFVPSLATPPSSGSPGTDRTASETTMQIGSTEFADLIHKLAQQVDDPTDIIDTARRAGIKMSLLRSGGSQTPLNLWTAILTRAVRDGKVDRLISEAYQPIDPPPEVNR